MWLLIVKGYLDLDSMAVFLKDIPAVFLTITLEMTVLALSLTRWHLILRAIGLRIDFFETVRIGMIGQFFSIAIPGTVSGDVVKCVYVAKLARGKTGVVFSSVLLDRLLGFAAMVFLAVTSLLLWALFAENDINQMNSTLSLEFNYIKNVQLAVVLTLSLFIVFFVTPTSLKSRAHLFLRETYQAIREFSRDRRALVYTVSLSLLMHILNACILLVVAYSVYAPPPWGDITPGLFITASMIGLAAMAIPITPAGLGVGQAAFSGIFFLLGAPDPAFGATVITGYHIVFITVGALGFIFLVLFPSKPESPET